MIRSFFAQEGKEYFISWESVDATVLFGFLRLRHPKSNVRNTVFPELNDVALIRELHVYGRTTAVGTSSQSLRTVNAVQHLGIGRTLLDAAEQISMEAAYSRIAVISGVGVQEYYEKSGYSRMEGQGEFLAKSFTLDITVTVVLFLYLFIFMLCVILL